MSILIMIYQFAFGLKDYKNPHKVHAKIVTAFIPNKGTTRTCLDCGKLVFGGVTRCSRCADKYIGYTLGGL